MPLNGEGGAILVFFQNMKLNLQIVAAGLLVLGATTLAPRSAHALPTALGAYPSTDISTKGNFRNDIAAYTSTNVDTTVLPTQGLEYGTGPDKPGVFGRSEFGYDYNFTSAGKISFGKRIFGNVKTQLYNDDNQQIRVVGGRLVARRFGDQPELRLSARVQKLQQNWARSRGLCLRDFDAGCSTPPTRQPTIRLRHRGAHRFNWVMIASSPRNCSSSTDYYSGKGPFAGYSAHALLQRDRQSLVWSGLLPRDQQSRQSRATSCIYRSPTTSTSTKPAPENPANSNPAPSNGATATPDSPTNGGPAPVAP